MQLSDKDIELTAEIVSDIELDTLEGKPESGHKSTIEDEQWRDSIAEATIREAVREVSKEYVDLEDRDEQPHTRTLFDPANIDTIYLSQYPWRAPFMAIELKECPKWAQITRAKITDVQTHPATTPDQDVVYFQVREVL